ncbi:MAG: tungsten cofactor oxidoreductase radical SAM maturase [Thermoflexales bacterium]|nr:tungsten cofactor oxidoreductase radical SAM maturase [Thermoflexales bacterium]
MPKAILGQDGSLKLPDALVQRQRLSPGLECWVNQRNGAVILLPRLPDLRKLYVEPTTACNLNCSTCIRNVWEDPNSHMTLDTFGRVMEGTQAFPDLQRVVFSGLGEPLLHPHILDMVSMVRERDLAVTIGSNGLLLNEAVARELVSLGVDRLVISLDGVKPETYAGVRGAAMAKVLDNIRGLNEAKRELASLTPALGIEFVALKSNIAELAELSSLASRLGATRVLVSNVLAYTDEMRDEILYGYEPRPPFSAGSWPVKADAWVMWGTLDLPRMHWGAEQRCRFVQDRAAVVRWDGHVSPCYPLLHTYSYLTIDGRRKQVTPYSLGDVKDQSLLEIWTSEDYSHFRSEVLDFHFPSCPDCDLRDTCDLRERNEGCWGWNPSCADCLWAQDIIRCP